MKRFAIIGMLAAMLVVVPAADARSAPLGLPSLLCREPTPPVGPFRPRPENPSTNLTIARWIFERSPGFEQSSHLLAIRWLRWGGSSALVLGDFGYPFRLH
jgi:hypothetical protein